MRHRTSRWARITALVALVAIVLTLFLPAIAMARAGGGQVGGGSRSSGGSSSSRSSGSGSSSSRSSGSGSSGLGTGAGGFSLGGCCGGGGLVVAIIVVVVIFMLINRKGGGGSDPGGMDSGPPMPPSAPADLNLIKAGDPDFNEEMFLGRVNEMFVAIQYAWMNRNMEPVRRFLSDQQFSILNNSVQTDYIAKGQINKLDNVHITEMHPVEVTRQGDFDAVKMLITAACIDYTVDERTGQIVNPAELGDGTTSTTFQEYWTFMRKAGVKSKMDSTIQKCPNCGAPVTDGNYVKCAYCGTQMNDPTLDWVLLRIEQV
jgi:hypothetical protein